MIKRNTNTFWPKAKQEEEGKKPKTLLQTRPAHTAGEAQAQPEAHRPKAVARGDTLGAAAPLPLPPRPTYSVVVPLLPSRMVRWWNTKFTVPGRG
jgi:hypothetical protein